MPKLRTNKSLAKRFRFTKRGKIKMGHANRGHILCKKSRSRKRGLRKTGYVNGHDFKKVSKLLPYGNE